MVMSKSGVSSDAAKVVQIGGTGWNTMVQLSQWFASAQGSGAAHDWFQALGSTGAGKALNMQQLGFDVLLHSLLGDDEAAAKIAAALTSVQCDWYAYQGASEQHLNLMSPDGSRQSIFLELEPDIEVPLTTAVKAAWQQADYCWVNIKPWCRRLLPALQALEQPIWCDLHDYDEGNPFHQPFIDAASYLMASGEALPCAERFMAQQIEAGKQLVIVTDGANPLRAMDCQGQLHSVMPIQGLTLVDSNGAGDAFSAGFLYGWHRQQPLEVCLQLGACAGALCIGSRQLAAPEMDETALLQLWQRHYG